MTFLVISAGVFPVGLESFFPFWRRVGAGAGAGGVGAGRSGQLLVGKQRVALPGEELSGRNEQGYI